MTRKLTEWKSTCTSHAPIEFARQFQIKFKNSKPTALPQALHCPEIQSNFTKVNSKLLYLPWLNLMLP